MGHGHYYLPTLPTLVMHMHSFPSLSTPTDDVGRLVWPISQTPRPFLGNHRWSASLVPTVSPDARPERMSSCWHESAVIAELSVCNIKNSKFWNDEILVRTVWTSTGG